MHSWTFRRVSVPVVVVILVVALAGCGVASDDQSDTSATTAPKTTEPTDEELISKATRLAASYCYDRALEVLESVDGTKAHKLTSVFQSEKAAMVPWPQGKPVPHLFFHSLIVDPGRAFDRDARAEGYDDYMATIPEFKDILQSLFNRGYVLVMPHDIAAVGDDQKMHYRPLALPKGKKPIILSQDDLSYYEYMEGDGFAQKLIIGPQGRVRNVYIDASGTKHTGTYDMVPILDDFVAKHPGFSYQGAMGVIAMTGYDGVLGYKTSMLSHTTTADVQEQRTKARKVAEAMTANGWAFASHTWGHINLETSSLARIRRDHTRWEREVKPIVGPTDMLIYPFGADFGTRQPYSGAIYQFYKKQGFDFFFNVDGTGPWQQMAKGYLRQGRINIDWIMLRRSINGTTDVGEPYMNPEAVIDDARKGID